MKRKRLSDNFTKTLAFSFFGFVRVIARDKVYLILLSKDFPEQLSNAYES